MDALELLREDHVRTRHVMQALGKTEAPAARAQLFTLLERDLDLHEAIEEEILYPELQANPKATELVLERLEEHDVVHTLMGELDALPLDHVTWGARCRVMIENLKHHMAEEEGEIFPRARKILGRRRLAELGTRMVNRRGQRLTAAFHPLPVPGR
jgi:iron-sulfur cluster repair protein YtfE (RIC family)